MNWLREKIEGVTKPEEEPRLPNFPICCPFLYHDIVRECGQKRIVAMMAMVAYFVSLGFFAANFVGAIIHLVAGFIHGPAAFGLFYLAQVCISGVFLLIVPVGGFFFQYWSAYSACASSNAGKYCIFFITQTICIIIPLIMAVGVQDIGGCGILSGLTLLLKSTTKNGAIIVGAIYAFIMALLWFLLAIYQLVILLIMVRFFQKENVQLMDAKNQLMGFIFKQQLKAAI